MNKIINKLLFNYNNKNKPTTEEVRKQLLSIILIVNILAFPMLILGTLEAIKLQQIYTGISFAVFYLPILSAFLFQKRLPYKITVFLLLFSGFSIGVINIIVYGFSGAGLPIFCVIAVLATLFYGIRAGFITIFTCSIPMLIVAVFMTNNLLSPGVDLMEISTLAISWATAIIVMLFLGSIMIYAFGIIQRNLINALNYSKAQTIDLLKANNKHEAINEELRLTNDQLIIAINKAEESDRLKSAFLANMSHEIRTPMNGILGFAGLLKEPNLTGEKQQKYIQIIEKGGARMLNIINDIVSISKIESGQVEITLKETNINKQIEYIYTFFKPEVEKKGMLFSFRNSLPSKEAIINTDREKVYAILTNLVKNAIKYSEKGSIEFGYNLKKGSKLTELEFYVKDTGIGIPLGRQEAIFERFVQADIEDKMAQQGAGLGLSISKAYVEMFGGKIWVESEEENLTAGRTGGSTFYFTLPYQPPIKLENIDRHEISHFFELSSINNLKILIVEDDEPSEEFISIIVQKFANKILKVKTGTEAMEACRNNPDIDLVLMDIQIPEMNGYEATSKIREFNKDVIIIAQTAFAMEGDKEKAIAVGCNDYISKPIKIEELEKLIVKYMKKE
jgi:signal transduction histidine kinase